MTSQLLASEPAGATRTHPDPARRRTDALLEREVAEFMTPGCVVMAAGG
jgi:hypothetical protein